MGNYFSNICKRENRLWNKWVCFVVLFTIFFISTPRRIKNLLPKRYDCASFFSQQFNSGKFLVQIHRIKKKINVPYLTGSVRKSRDTKSTGENEYPFYWVLITLKFYSLFTLTLQSLQLFKQAQRILSNGLHTIEATFLQHHFFFGPQGARAKGQQTLSLAWLESHIRLMPRPHYAVEIWKRRFHSETHQMFSAKYAGGI